jgi:cell division control protein 6
MRQLTVNGHYTLLAVVSQAVSGVTPSRTRAIYEEYMTLCENSSVQPLGQRAIHNHLSDLRMLGILTVNENRSGSRGNYYSYELDVPLDSAIAALADVLRVPGIIEQLRETGRQSGAL